MYWIVAIVYPGPDSVCLTLFRKHTYRYLISFDHHLFQDLQEKFGEFGNLAEIHKIPGLVFYIS